MSSPMKPINPLVYLNVLAITLLDRDEHGHRRLNHMSASLITARMNARYHPHAPDLARNRYDLEALADND